MAQYHFEVKVLGRSGGRNAVRAAAYQSGERLHDERTNRTFDFTHKDEVRHSEIILPHDAPASYSDRATLWNAVEQAEQRKDSQLARELVLAVPKELDHEQGMSLAHDFIKREFVAAGMIADVAYHDKQDNPHVHVMLTMREVGPDGFGLKNREWNDRQLVNEWWQEWARTTNRYLELAGSQERIDHRSYKERGFEQEPTKHLGAAVLQMEARGIRTDKYVEHEAIEARNKEMDMKLTDLAETLSSYATTAYNTLTRKEPNIVVEIPANEPPLERDTPEIPSDDREKEARFEFDHAHEIEAEHGFEASPTPEVEAEVDFEASLASLTPSSSSEREAAWAKERGVEPELDEGLEL